jgi:hypothetical protein
MSRIAVIASASGNGKTTLGRTWRRLRTQEELWNGNRESLAAALGGRDSLFAYAIWSHFHRRRTWPRTLSRYRTIRLRTTTDVANLLASATIGIGPGGEVWGVAGQAGAVRFRAR